MEDENVWFVYMRNASDNKQKESLGTVKEIRPEDGNGRIDMCSPEAGTSDSNSTSSTDSSSNSGRNSSSGFNSNINRRGRMSRGAGVEKPKYTKRGRTVTSQRWEQASEV